MRAMHCMPYALTPHHIGCAVVHVAVSPSTVQVLHSRRDRGLGRN
jgi:hypothetical protein